MQQKRWRFGPGALTTAATNLVNPGTTTGGVSSTAAPYDKLRIIITHIRIVNKTAAACTVSLWVGATGATTAGTEFGFALEPCPANGHLDWYGDLPLDVADFLVGNCAANTTLTIQGEGFIGIY